VSEYQLEALVGRARSAVSDLAEVEAGAKQALADFTAEHAEVIGEYLGLQETCAQGIREAKEAKEASRAALLDAWIKQRNAALEAQRLAADLSKQDRWDEATDILEAAPSIPSIPGVSVVTSVAPVDVDLALLPKALQKVTANMPAIKALLKEGQVVPGVVMGESHSLTLRAK
jgi:hypothetical protein